MHPVAGSEREPFRNAVSVGDADATETLQVTLMVRSPAHSELAALTNTMCEENAAGDCLSREQFAERFGADPKDVATVKAFARDRGLSVVREDLPQRTLILSGTVAQFNAAFGVSLQKFQYDGGSYRGRTGAVYVPAELSGIVQAVMGLDDRPQASAHFRIADAVPASFTPPQLASLYDFPNPPNASGQHIGIIELGGGFRQSDITQYFTNLNVAAPNVTAVSVDGAQNAPTGDAGGPDAEVMLDIEVSGSVAPGAGIAVYFAPNTDAGFIDAVTTAIHDTVNKPSVISISWGSPESTWTQQAITAMDQAFQAAAALGVTVCVASGDNGSTDGVTDGTSHVDFPASSAFALACGGTTLQSNNGSIASETVWNGGAAGGASGGGVSAVFALPAYQKNLKVTDGSGKQSALTKRGVPDVSGDADPQSGYSVLVDGTTEVLGGTSAVAPLWAGLIALANAHRTTPVGLVHPKLYGDTAALHDITTGNNGAFSASAGWDACTGLGSPDGAKIVAALDA